MLSSSSEYINALREGHYLLFLQWVDFITKKYETKGADDLVNVLIFEWLSHSYSEEDAKKLAILQAVFEMESKPLQGKLDYSLKIISQALFLCMVFQKSAMDIQRLSQNQITGRTIDKLIGEKLAQLNPFTYEKRLEDAQMQFYEWVESADEKEVVDALAKINAVTAPRYLLEDYILHLERIKIKDDELYSARLSMAKRFLGYLYKQTEMSPKVAHVITTYVNSLRELHPSKGELECLNNISPPSAREYAWRWATGIGISFFSIVLREKSLGDLISGTNLSSNEAVNFDLKK